MNNMVFPISMPCTVTKKCQVQNKIQTIDYQLIKERAKIKKFP